MSAVDKVVVVVVVVVGWVVAVVLVAVAVFVAVLACSTHPDTCSVRPSAHCRTRFATMVVGVAWLVPSVVLAEGALASAAARSWRWHRPVVAADTPAPVAEQSLAVLLVVQSTAVVSVRPLPPEPAAVAVVALQQ